jgi:hypothetical protein
MTDEELAAAMGQLKGIDTWMGMVRDEAAKRLLAGVKLANVRLSLTSTRPTWHNTDAAFKFCAQTNVPVDDYAPRVLVPPKAMEGLFEVNELSFKPMLAFIERKPRTPVAVELHAKYEHLSVEQVREILARQDVDSWLR